MSVQGPNPYEKISHLEPVDGDRDDSHDEGRRRRKVVYRGRSWAQSEDELPMHPRTAQEKPTGGKHEFHLDRLLFERAKNMFAHLVTLEEKIAQLLFCQTEAEYDQKKQEEMEELLRRWQIGGLLFIKGEFKREAYLIEHYQQFAKTPLLVGNDLSHGLSFYFQGKPPVDTFQEKMTLQRYCDIGKAVMGQNRHLGVHFQMGQDRSSSRAQFCLAVNQLKSFLKGVRDAHGIVGRVVDGTASSSTLFSAQLESSSAGDLRTMILEQNCVHERVGHRSLKLYDFSADKKYDDLVEIIKGGKCDLILMDGDIPQAILAIKSAVENGEISEEAIDGQVMRILLHKALF